MTLYTLKYSGLDFRAFYEVGEFAIAKSDIYAIPPSDRVVFYSPFFALVMSPFSILPYSCAFFFWNAIKIICLIVLWQFFRSNVFVGFSKPSTMAYLPFLAVGPSIVDEFRLGQVNLLVLTALVLGFVHGGRKSFLLAASFIHIACLKVVPFLLVPAACRIFGKRFITWFVLIGFLVSLANISWYGLDHFTWLIDKYRSVSLSMKMNRDSFILYRNQSLISLLTYIFDLLKIHLSIDTLLVVYKVNLALGSTFLLVIARPGPVDNRDEHIVRFLGVALISVLLLSPATHSAHLIALIIPLSLIIRSSLLTNNRKYKVVTVALCLIFGLSGQQIIGHELLHAMRSFRIQTVAMLVILGMLTAQYFRVPKAT